MNVNDYNRILSKPGGKSYKNNLEIGVRSFIKGILCELYGLKKSDFSNYQKIIDFVKDYEPAKNLNLTKQSISNLRNRRMIIKNVPRVQDVEDFALYVRSKIPHFDFDSFFK